MTLNDGLNYINFMVNKENSGGNLDPKRFGYVLQAVNIELFNQKVAEAQMYALQNKVPFDETIDSFKILREFRAESTITFTSGTYNLTALTSYSYWVRMLTQYNGFNREVELVTDKELINRRSNLLGKKLQEYPAAKIIGNLIKIYPTDIATAEFTYLNRPATPIFDYYLDANQNMIYFPAGTNHTLATGETGSANQTSGTINSLTVELSWNPDYHMDFFNAVLMKLAANLQNEQMKQVVREVEGKQI
jgi:hypothetical protein